MTNLRRLASIAVLAVFMAVPSCSGVFDQCVKPYSSQLTWKGSITELGDIVGAFMSCDPTFSGGEAPACAIAGLEALEPVLGPDAAAIENCVIAYWQTHGTSAQQAAAKAVGAKRGVNVSKLECKGLVLRTPAPAILQSAAPIASAASIGRRADGTTGRLEASGDAPGSAPFAYAGPNVGAVSAACSERCGSRDSIASTYDNCQCWRRDRANPRGHWVSLAPPTPGEGAPALLAAAGKGQ